MHEFKSEIMARRSQGNWDGKYLYQIIGQDLVDRSPFYHLVEAGRCMLCSRILDEHYMFFMGQTSKSLCENCYQSTIVNQINYRCIISNQMLPQSKIDIQYQNSRELTYNIADGAAFDKWLILHEKVTKGDMSWLADEQEQMQDYQLPPIHSQQEGFVIIEGVIVEEEQYPVNALPPGVKGKLTEGKPRTYIDINSTDRPEKVTVDKDGRVIKKEVI